MERERARHVLDDKIQQCEYLIVCPKLHTQLLRAEYAQTRVAAAMQYITRFEFSIRRTLFKDVSVCCLHTHCTHIACDCQCAHMFCIQQQQKSVIHIMKSHIAHNETESHGGKKTERKIEWKNNKNNKNEKEEEEDEKTTSSIIVKPSE